LRWGREGRGRAFRERGARARTTLPTAPPRLSPPSYEAWVIYNFLALCLAYVGGPGRVEVAQSGVVLAPSWARCTCCLAPTPVDGAFVRRCKRGALQFVFVKPLLAGVTIALHAKGLWTDGDWSPAKPLIWVTLAYNATYTVALYSLLLFYVGTADLLAPHKPLLKFAAVKAVVFATFWQSLLIAALVGARVVASPADGKALNALVLCVEMLPAAVAMAFAFPAAEYGGGATAARLDASAVRHAVSIRDVVTDTVHQFAPAYHDYVLYDGGGGGGGGGGDGAPGGGGGGPNKKGAPPAPRVARGHTFLRVGRETAARSGAGLLEMGGTAARAPRSDDPEAALAAAPRPANPFAVDDDEDYYAAGGRASGGGDGSPRVAAVADAAPPPRPPRRLPLGRTPAPAPPPDAAAPLDDVDLT